MRVLGIDPGLSKCGWAILEESLSKNYNLLSYGEITTEPQNKFCISERLKKIFLELKKIIKKYKPEIVCIESQFYSKISKNMINTYFATSIIYLVCSLYNIKLKEFSAKTVKMAVSGYGSASKFQVKKMVEILLPDVPRINSEHINDAIAVALCFFNTNRELYV
ncbi:MAG: crossover junction endodeoxyribonuclease RuvC [Endomicrobiia bacterium]